MKVTHSGEKIEAEPPDCKGPSEDESDGANPPRMKGEEQERKGIQQIEGCSFPDVCDLMRLQTPSLHHEQLKGKERITPQEQKNHPQWDRASIHKDDERDEDVDPIDSRIC